MKVHKPIEQAVFREAKKLLSSSDGDYCRCPQCQADTVAIALRNLPNRYSTTDRGEVLINLEIQSSQLQLDIFRAVQQAAKTVAESPRH